MTATTAVTRLEFDTDGGLGVTARLGLVVLENDQTIEAEVAALCPDGVAAFVTRISMDDRITPEALRAMEERIPAAARLLPSTLGLDAVGYGCTSAATLIGEERVAAAVRQAHPDVPNTNPISAVRAALSALGARRIAVVTPYSAEVTSGVVDLLAEDGLDVAVVGSFLEESDSVVARITEAAVADGVRRVVAEATAAGGPVDAVFVSCTSLRVVGVAGELEAELDAAVVSSNLAFAWHLLRLAGVDGPLPGPGRLQPRPLP